MKKPALASLALAAGLAGLLASCKEKGSVVYFGHSVPSSDTSYLATAEAPEARRILIEEFTGVTCPNCPTGHATIASIEKDNPEGRVLAIGYYAIGPGQTRPVPNLTQQDFRTQDATDLANAIYGGAPQLPSGAVSRTKDAGGNLLSGTNAWASIVTSQINLPTPVNLKVTSSYNDNSSTATVKVRVAFTQSFSKKVLLNIAVVEDSIIDAQELPGGTTIDTFYVHKHVLRDLVSMSSGDPILTTYATIEKGRVYERTLNVPMVQPWNPRHCKIIAFLATDDATDKTILQAAQAPVKP